MDTTEVSALIRDVTARVILPRWRNLGPGQVFDKGYGDLVTVADQEAEAEFTRALGGPDVLVVGEEAISVDPSALVDLPSADQAWLVDPVDGTANFDRGSENFAVMIAELHAGQPVRSWIYQPARERLYVAVAGEGVTCNGDPLRPLPRTDPLNGPLQRGRPTEMPPWLHRVSSARCCGVEYPALIEGRLDFLGYRSSKPWDHLPGALMVTELGGRSATLDGRDDIVHSQGQPLLVAATRPIWDRVRAVMS